MKKIILHLLLVLILVNYAYALPFAAIGMQGLSFIGPQGAQVAEIVDKVMCVSNPVLCLEGKVIGQVTGKAFEEVAKASPEAAKAITTYNQIKGYVDQGASVVQELKVNSNGEIESGSMQFTKTATVGNLVGKDIKQDDITVSNVKFTKENGASTFTFDENSNVQIKTKDASGKIVGRSFSDLKKDSTIKLNDKGEITEADVTSGKKENYLSFGDKTIKVPPDTHVVYRDGQIVVYGKDKEINLASQSDTLSKGTRIKVDGDSVTINGNKVIGKSFEGDGFKVTGLNKGFGEVTFNGNKIVQVGKQTDAIIQGIEHITGTGALNVYYDNKFDPSVHQDENYFNYGIKKIQLGGEGFTSRVKQGNTIFPEFLDNEYQGSHAERESRLEFSPNKGNLEISKTSLDNRPLALQINSNGNFIVNNGRWNLEADGTNVYDKIVKKPQYPLSYDLNFNYNSNDGTIKRYTLEANTQYLGKQKKGEGFVKGKGFFGQVLSTQDGNSHVSYAEYIEGFPVIPNSKTYYYFDKQGNKLTEPQSSKFESNKNILDYIPETKYQDCAGAVQTLYGNYQFQDMSAGDRDSVKFRIENGKTLEYRNDGSYTVWDSKLKKIVTQQDENVGDSYNKWLQNVQAYSDTETLASRYKSVKDLNSLKPGDVIAMVYGEDNPRGVIAGHTQIVKEVVDIHGQTYYKVYGGSTPAHTVREEGSLESAYNLGLMTQVVGNTKVIRFEEEKRPLIAANP